MIMKIRRGWKLDKAYDITWERCKQGRKQIFETRVEFFIDIEYYPIESLKGFKEYTPKVPRLQYIFYFGWAIDSLLMMQDGD